MTEGSWQAAHAIARELVKRDCDPNEVYKAFVYLRTHKDGDKFFLFLDNLAKHGQFFVRSRRTLDYYQAIQDVCRQYLFNHRANPEAMSQILGWAVRLMRYYMAKQARTEMRPRTPPPRRR
jgi:hypothetical protein